MNILIAGLKWWPLHHEVEHLLAEALQVDGNNVSFLGCSPRGMMACECVDRAVHEQSGGHANFCRSCITRQGGVHQRAGFEELPMPWSAAADAEARRRTEGLGPEALLDLQCCGHPLRELLGPSLMRWSRSGRPPEACVPLDVMLGHAHQALIMESLIPAMLEEREIELVLVLNGLFFAERLLYELAGGLGIRVVNYERSHVRNAIVVEDRQPACYLEIDNLLPAGWEKETHPRPLLDHYLKGRASNRDASTRFGTGQVGETASMRSRKQVVIFTNVCWDSAVSTRPSPFGSYLGWLEAMVALGHDRPDLDFVIRVHPGEARLDFDPTLERTETWLAEYGLPKNMTVLPAESDRSSYELMAESELGIVFVSSVGLEMACLGKPVVVCARGHYAGKGFTSEADPGTLSATVSDLLKLPPDPDEVSRKARSYADRLFFDAPIPFPWIDEIEYGRPQRVAPPLTKDWLEADRLLGSLVDRITGKRPHAITLREYLAEPAFCPLPFHFGSRLRERDPRIGVLIPAYGRPERLLKTLKGYQDQNGSRDRFMVLVVDDGSERELEELLRPAFPANRPRGLELHVIRLENNRGPAAARNAGLDWFEARDDSPENLFITGDDMIPQPDLIDELIAEIVAWNDERVAILGKVEWDPELQPNRVMRLVESNGMQFGFRNLPARARLGENFFYTSSIALSRGWLRRTRMRFNEDFPFAAWEDMEFGVRAFRQGLVLCYTSRIAVKHNHRCSYRDFAERQRKAGSCARVFHQLHPVEFARIAGNMPADPPDRVLMEHMERALSELSKLNLDALKGLPGKDGDLADQLSREQDQLLTHLFRMNSDRGWFERPLLELGRGRQGLLSILVPVYNQWALTKACIEAIRRNTSGDYEIVVVDNGSSDATGSELKQTADLRVVRVPRNLGFSRGNNLAALESRGESLVLLNNDTEVHPGWDLPLREELADDEVGAVGSKLLFPHGSVQHAGLVFRPDGLPWHLYQGFAADAPEVSRRREFNALTGACLAIRRSLYAQLKGLDESFVNCYEDIDFCLKLRSLGRKLVYRPDSVVTHHAGRTEGREDRTAHGWLLILDRWKDRLPNDEARQLAEDGWIADRDQGELTLRRYSEDVADPEPGLPLLAREWIRAGRITEARDLLLAALNPARTGAASVAVLRELAELELAAGNIQALEQLATMHEFPADLKERLQQVRHRNRRELGERGIHLVEYGGNGSAHG